MAMTDLPVLGALAEKMRWLTARQSVIAENVAQADVPGYRARDLVRPDFGKLAEAEAGGLSMRVTNRKHMAAPGGVGTGHEPRVHEEASWVTSPDGNSVVLEQEMMKVSETVGEFRAAANIYAKSIGLLRMAIGK